MKLSKSLPSIGMNRLQTNDNNLSLTPEIPWIFLNLETQTGVEMIPKNILTLYFLLNNFCVAIINQLYTRSNQRNGSKRLNYCK